MKTFKDGNDLEWTLEVNVGSARRVRDLTGFVLLTPDIPAMITKLCGDLVMAIDVTYALCKPQADSRNLTDEQFGVALRGADINAIVKAITEEVIDFFPQCREAVMRIFAATEKLTEKAAENLAELLKGDALERAIETTLNPPVGDSPGLLASMHGHSHSGN